MKFIFLFLLCSTSFAATSPQTQDIGGSSITWNAAEAFNGAVTILGSTTFNGAVALSSCTANLQGQTGASSTRYNLAATTITFSVTGSNPVKVCFTGSITENGTSPEADWSFTVDSAFVDGLTNTVGAHSTVAGMCNGCTADVSSCYPIKSGVVAKGSHTWALLPSGGPGNTWTMGNLSVNKFCVEEQH